MLLNISKRIDLSFTSEIISLKFNVNCLAKHFACIFLYHVVDFWTF